MEGQIEKIDLREYCKSGEGSTGSSYFGVADSNVMLKFFIPEYPQELIVREVELARKVCDLGVPSPEPGNLVTDGERLGIKFRRIVGKRSYSRIFADEPDRIEEFSREFARRCLQLHSIECPKGMFPDVKDEYRSMLAADKYLSDGEKQVILDFINNVKDANNALHGDLTYGNCISTLPQGAPLSDPHDVYFIDLGNFSQGDPLFDLGMFVNISLYTSDEFLFHAYHIHKDDGRRVWEAFVDEYFGGSLTPAQAEDLLRPYQALKMLFVEYSVGTLKPWCVTNLRESFGL
jgi:Predicted choline kinase involved in LPS biosynthesis